MAVVNFPKSANARLYYLAAFLSFWFLAICVRLVWLQVADHADFTRQAARQQQRSIEVSPVRGNIYDRNGNGLAMSVSVDSFFAVPSEIANLHAAAGTLARVLKTNPAEMEKRLRASRAFAWVARKTDGETSARIRALGLKGIYPQKESKRFYPKRELAAQVIGYVGLDDGGLGGVERAFEARLKGKPGSMLISMDAKRHWFGRVEKDPDPGENVVLTLDEKIQYVAERELAQAMRDTGAETGTIIVEDPRTGEVLALANSPTFNPNGFNSSDVKALKDRAVSDIYEPGSTFKIVTLAAALEEKLTNPDEVIDCEMGSIVVNGRRIHDHHPFGDLTVAQILQHSSDVGAIKLALRLGEEKFDRYIRAFGFGSQTGIELPGETRGMTKPVSRWSKVSIGAISMGQEIGVSPVQLISMVSSIANDGLYVPIRVVAGATPPRGAAQRITFHPAEGRRVISPLTAAQMKRMMEGVVLGGTGRKALLNGYSSAGKTGTAQKIDPATGAYAKHRVIASFAGFAPVNNPAVTVLVVLDSPLGPRHEGGDVAAPVFARVAQQVLEYLNVPHDVEFASPQRLRLQAQNKAHPIQDVDVAEGATERIAADPEPANASAVPASASKPDIKLVPATYPAPSSPPPATTQDAPAGSRVVLDEGADKGVAVPNFMGKSLRAALEEAQAAGLELEPSGSGAAQSQSPPAGTKIPHGGRVSVKFAR